MEVGAATAKKVAGSLCCGHEKAAQGTARLVTQVLIGQVLFGQALFSMNLPSINAPLSITNVV